MFKKKKKTFPLKQQSTRVFKHHSTELPPGIIFCVKNSVNIQTLTNSHILPAPENNEKKNGREKREKKREGEMEKQGSFVDSIWMKIDCGKM